MFMSMIPPNILGIETRISDPSDDNDECYKDPLDAEEPYLYEGTIYDLINEAEEYEVTAELEDGILDIENSDKEEYEAEEDIYAGFIFDAENADQLKGDIAPNEYIVTFVDQSDVPGKEKQLIHEIEKFHKIGYIDGLGAYVINHENLQMNPNGALNRLKNNKYIKSVEPNYTATYEYIPNDPGYKNQSAVLTAIGAQSGWDIIRGGGPIIAVIDSGVAYNSDLPPLLHGYSAVSSLAFSNDIVGHGTGVAGTIGAVGDNGIGGAGINWNANIMPVKVDEANGTLSVANIAKGIIWAADNGAKIINLSLGTTSDSITFRNAIDYAYNKGCVIFAATGNDGKLGINYPSRYPNVMAVGASGNGTSRSAISNYGPGIDVLAISSFYTTSSTDSFASMAGTSFSSPQVAGLASLVWALNPYLTNNQVYEMIRQGAKGGGFYVNDEIGYGCIDIGKTLRLAQASAGGSSTAASDAEAEAKAKAEAEAEAKAKAEADAKAKAEAEAKAKAEAEAKAKEEAEKLPPETPQETRTAPVITLAGFSEMSLDFGQKYIESGYKAVDCKGVDLTEKVVVENSVNSYHEGIYIVAYSVEDHSGLTARVSRQVTVLPQPIAIPTPAAPKITVNGSNPIILHSTSATVYKEQGARAVDGDGTDISVLVSVSGAISRVTPGTYTLTYSVTSPKSWLTSTTSRDVRIVGPTEKRDPRVKYGLSGQAKQGGKITHTGVVAGVAGFMDLKVSGIDKNMAISVQLVDTDTKKAVMSDSFTATGGKQYKIDKGKYELVVNVDKANGNSKYDIELLMPETATVLFFEEAEVPLSALARVAPIGSNPIILHLGGTPYMEQGARARDLLGNDISDRIQIIGQPDTSKAGTYTVIYKVTSVMGFGAQATREVRVLAPDVYGLFKDEEVPLYDFWLAMGVTENARSYVIEEGDTLWKIALKRYGDAKRWREIYDMNKETIGRDPDRIIAGKTLRLKAG